MSDEFGSEPKTVEPELEDIEAEWVPEPEHNIETAASMPSDEQQVLVINIVER